MPDSFCLVTRKQPRKDPRDSVVVVVEVVVDVVVILVVVVIVVVVESGLGGGVIVEAEVCMPAMLLMPVLIS